VAKVNEGDGQNSAGRGPFATGFRMLLFLTCGGLGLFVVYVLIQIQTEGHNNAVTRTTVNALAQACERYALDNGGRFPNALNDLLTSPPVARRTSSRSRSLDPWGCEFHYAYPGPHHPSGNKPDIWSTGEKGDRVIGNWTD